MDTTNTAAATAAKTFPASTFVSGEANEKINAIAARDDRKRAYVLRELIEIGLANMPGRGDRRHRVFAAAPSTKKLSVGKAV